MVNWESKTVSCCATTFIGKTSVILNKVQAETSPIIDDVKILDKEDDGSDDYENMETFSPVYLSIILIVICAIIVALESVRDFMQSSRTKLIIAENEVDTPKDISNVSSIEKLEPAIFKNVGPLPMADAVRVVDRDNNRMGGSFGHEMLASIDDYSHVAMW